MDGCGIIGIRTWNLLTINMSIFIYIYVYIYIHLAFHFARFNLETFRNVRGESNGEREKVRTKDNYRSTETTLGTVVLHTHTLTRRVKESKHLRTSTSQAQTELFHWHPSLDLSQSLSLTLFCCSSCSHFTILYSSFPFLSTAPSVSY